MLLSSPQVWKLRLREERWPVRVKWNGGAEQGKEPKALGWLVLHVLTSNNDVALKLRLHRSNWKSITNLKINQRSTWHIWSLSRCKWVLKALYPKEWPNCAFREEKHVAGMWRHYIHGRQHLCIKDNSYTFLSFIMSQNCTYVISNPHSHSERGIHRGENEAQPG